tara:strand:- start:573 stop:1121 length:549 start_codon:yes stop_codon:yes gene_type:complete
MPVTINGDGSITGLSVGGLPDGCVDTDTLANSAASGVKLGTGAVIQVKQAESSSQISQSSSTDFDIVTVSLTPTAVGNKIFVFGCVMGIQNGSGNNNTRFLCRVVRDSTNLMNSDANHWLQSSTTVLRHGGFSINYIDTAPSTNATTYKLVGYWTDTSSQNCFVNKDNNSGSSTITVMEVKG